MASLRLLASFPLLVSLSRCHTSTLFPASDSTLRLSGVYVSFVLVCVYLWLGDVTTYLFPFSWYCTQIAFKGTPLLPPVQFSGVSHTPPVPPFWCCLCHCLGVVFHCVFAICFGSLGFPFYSSTKGLMLASWVPHYGPCASVTPQRTGSL